MQNVLIYAPTAATRKLYHQNLSKRDYDLYKAKDLAELLLLLVSFEIDTVVVVDEGKAIHEVSMVIDILLRRFDYKRLILVSLQRRNVNGFECYLTSGDFFDSVV